MSSNWIALIPTFIFWATQAQAFPMQHFQAQLNTVLPPSSTYVAGWLCTRAIETVVDDTYSDYDTRDVPIKRATGQIKGLSDSTKPVIHDFEAPPNNNAGMGDIDLKIRMRCQTSSQQPTIETQFSSKNRTMTHSQGKGETVLAVESVRNCKVPKLSDLSSNIATTTACNPATVEILGPTLTMSEFRESREVFTWLQSVKVDLQLTKQELEDRVASNLCPQPKPPELLMHRIEVRGAAFPSLFVHNFKVYVKFLSVNPLTITLSSSSDSVNFKKDILYCGPKVPVEISIGAENALGSDVEYIPEVFNPNEKPEHIYVIKKQSWADELSGGIIKAAESRIRLNWKLEVPAQDSGIDLSDIDHTK